MKNKVRGGRVMTVITVALCVILVAAIAWGIINLMTKLSHYGENATIQKDPETQEEEIISGPPEEELEENKWSKEGFFEVNGLRRYQHGDYVGAPGVDVSSYQGHVDWEAVKKTGVEFAMLRVGYRGWSTGELALDECFHENVEGAKAAGLDVGVYFFSQALSMEEAIEEAEFTLEQIKDLDLTYPIMFDWEEVEADARTDEMNMLLLTTCALAFCQTVEEAGYDAGVYFNLAYGYEQLNLASLDEYSFWLAEYGDYPSFCYDFSLWQYTNAGTVPGIDGNVDLNIAFRRK